MRKFQIHNYQKQVILGTVLGTSCVRKHPNGINYSLHLRLTKDEEWFRVKCKHLEEYARDTDFDKTWESCSHVVWNDFFDLCYVDGHKEVTMDWLNRLTTIGLSVWFLDKGGICGDLAYIRIANLNGHDIVKKWFIEVGFPCEIEKKLVVFSKDVSRKFLKSVTPHFPKYLLERSNPYFIRKSL